MSVSARLYAASLQDVFAGAVDWVAGPIKATLVGSAYVPDATTDRFLADVAANEVAGTRVDVTGRGITFQTSALDTVLTSDPLAFPAVTGAFSYVVVYAAGADDATSPLVGYIDLGEELTAAGQTFALDASAAFVVRGTI